MNTNAHTDGGDAYEQQHTQLKEERFIRVRYDDASTSVDEDRIQFLPGDDHDYKKRPVNSNLMIEVNAKRSKKNRAAVIAKTCADAVAVNIANHVNPVPALYQPCEEQEQQAIGNTEIISPQKTNNEYTNPRSNSNTVPISFKQSDLHLHKHDVVAIQYGGQKYQNISTQGSKKAYTDHVENLSTRARFKHNETVCN